MEAQVMGYLPREVKIRLKAELARRDLSFSDWLRSQARSWLDNVDNHAASEKIAVGEEDV
jgi:hypothetical protein